jgi:serine/threonine protein kinase
LKIKLLSRLGGGAFADVWQAKDQFDRDVAVKIVRGTAALMSSALAHAKALARTSHPNVVSMISLEKVKDPDSGKSVDGIVMELVEGTTLEERLRGPKLSASEARVIGAAIASGIAHIHAQAMEHGDLHDANIMIAGSKIKIIDILYTDSLAMLSSGSRSARLRRDRVHLKLVLQHIIAHSCLPTAETTKFNDLLGENPTALDIREAFLKVADAENLTETERVLTSLCERLKGEEFVGGKAPAAALMDETPPALMVQLLIRIINSRSYEQRHREYLLALSSRLAAEERSAFLSHLGAELEKELPKGRWWPQLKMLSALQREAWRALTPRFRRILETTITKDVLCGRLDGSRNQGSQSEGSIGTYAQSLWPHFSKPHDLADNIISLLHKSDQTQNYVGQYFLTVLPTLAERTHTADPIIRALKGAVENNAKVVIDGLGGLPEDWVAKIKPQTR